MWHAQVRGCSRASFCSDLRTREPQIKAKRINCVHTGYAELVHATYARLKCDWLACGSRYLANTKRIFLVILSFKLTCKDISTEFCFLHFGSWAEFRWPISKGGLSLDLTNLTKSALTINGIQEEFPCLCYLAVVGICAAKIRFSYLPLKYVYLLFFY